MLNRDQAFAEMEKGNKIIHFNFTSDEYYHLVNGNIIAEDNVNHTRVFWSTSFMSNGWSIYN